MRGREGKEDKDGYGARSLLPLLLALQPWHTRISRRAGDRQALILRLLRVVMQANDNHFTKQP